jgi:hypothetical protein
MLSEGSQPDCNGWVSETGFHNYSFMGGPGSRLTPRASFAISAHSGNDPLHLRTPPLFRNVLMFIARLAHHHEVEALTGRGATRSQAPGNLRALATWRPPLGPSGFKAAAELYLLYAANGRFVSHNSIIRHMADRFQKLDISSCRGATMTRERVDWLYENKLQRLAPMKV